MVELEEADLARLQRDDSGAVSQKIARHRVRVGFPASHHAGGISIPTVEARHVIASKEAMLAHNALGVQHFKDRLLFLHRG